jgi:hypothetical protein
MPAIAKVIPFKKSLKAVKAKRRGAAFFKKGAAKPLPAWVGKRMRTFSSATVKPNSLNVVSVRRAENAVKDRYLSPTLFTDSPGYWETEPAYFDGVPDNVTNMGMEPGEDYLVDVDTASTDKPWYEKSIEKAVEIWGTVEAQKSAQKQADKLQAENLRRARMGLPMISGQQYGAMRPPAATVAFGLSPDVKNMLLFGGLGLGALLLLPRLLKR